MAPDQIRAMLMALVARVDLKSDRVEIKVRRRSLRRTASYAID